MNLILIDCDPGYAAEWNRWYDTDHLAEFLALDGVVAAHRYVAPADLHATRQGPVSEGLQPGSAAYCTIVLVGPDAEAAAVGRAGMAATHNRLIAVAGRMPDWDRITPRYIEGFDLATVAAAPSVPVMADALLHRAHRGVLVELFDTDDQEATEAWLDSVHIPRLLQEPGVDCAARFHPALLPDVEAPWAGDEAEAGSRETVRLLVLAPLESDPGVIAAALRAGSDASERHRQGERRWFHGVFRRIENLDYGFVPPRAQTG
jgi:hypothetical protein